ncbi:MAG: ATP-binding protein [Anaerolineae bacterium]
MAQARPDMELTSLQGSFFPTAPRSIEETGLNMGLIADLVLKTLYYEGYMPAAAVADAVCLPFTGVIDQVLEFLKRERLVEVKGSSGALRESAYLYAITERGGERARELLERSRYVGPAPVPLERYKEAVHAQSVRRIFVTPAMVREALSHLVLDESIIDRVGPAINSGQSIFLFGPPGDGKTSIAEAIGSIILKGTIYIPQSLVIGGHIVTLYDVVNHRTVPNDENERHLDKRWIKIRRPNIIVGGELTLNSLDLIFNEVSLFYDAPFQLKANGGMLLIDDFGRQLARPEDLLNRWIVPLEKGVDYLTLHTGRKIEVPFDVLLIFSTNLSPAQLVDEAFLRRIQHKIYIKDPTLEQYREIFQRVCAQRGVPYDDKGLAYLLKEHYLKPGIKLRACHPRDLIDHLVGIARYRGVPPRLTPELIDAAWESYFVNLQSDVS